MALNLFVGFGATLLVNWLADWLPGIGSEKKITEKRHRGPRWGGLFLVGVLFAFYRSFPIQNPESSASVNPWVIWFCFAVFSLILVIDLEHRRVLNIVVYPMAGVAFALALWRTDLSLTSAIVGGLVGFGIFLLLYSVRPGALGAGDVKMAGLIGLLVGFPGVIVALLSAITLGGLGAGFLLIFRRVGIRGTMAYAPYLSVGAMIALLFGQSIVQWYAGRFGL
ncbi:MAG: A24 family peptidase [Caldilineaceae bacterium]